MIGLGKSWRFTVRNSSAVDLAAAGVTIAARYVRIDPYGKQEYAAADAVVFTAGATVNGAYATGTEIDNATDKWLGGDFVATVIAPAGATGRVDVFYERKVNGQWPTNGNGKLICQISTPASGTFYQDFSI